MGCNLITGTLSNMHLAHQNQDQDQHQDQPQDETLLKDPETRAFLIAVLSGRSAPIRELITELVAAIPARRTIERSFPELLSRIDHRTRLAVTCNVLEHIVLNGLSNGSFSRLVYDHLNFTSDDYPFLFAAGGKVVTDHLSLEISDLTDTRDTARPGDD